MVARRSTAIPSLGSATITGLGSATVTGLCSTAIPGLSSAAIRALRCSASSIATGLAASISGCLARSVSGIAALSGAAAACLTSPVTRVSAGSTISTRCAPGSAIGACRAARSTIHSRSATARPLARVSTRTLRRGSMLRRSCMGCRSCVGGGCAAMFLRRSDRGYDQNNQQYRPFTQNLFF
jgi:hypothetical protein